MMIPLPPRGHLQKKEEILLLFGLSVAYASCLFIAWIISSKQWSRCIPSISGIVGMVTVITSVLLAPLVMPSGLVGRWDESFVEQCATISVLQMHQPMRVIIPLGFSFVCLGIAITTIKMWKNRNISFDIKKLSNGNNECKRFVVMTFLVMTAIVNFATILGALGTLIFARHTDGELHVFFTCIVFSSWSISPIIATSLMLFVNGKPPPNKLCLGVLTFLTILILTLSIFYVFAYSSKSSEFSKSLMRGEGDLALMEHIAFILELTWISTVGTQFLNAKQSIKGSADGKEKDLLSMCTASSTCSTDIKEKQYDIEKLRTDSFPNIIIEIDESDEGNDGFLR